MNANLRLSKPTRTKRYWLRALLMALPFLLGSISEVKAQCLGPYQYYESLPSSSALLTGNGWPNVVATISGTASVAYSGRYCAALNYNATTPRYVQTPAITNPGEFSFYWKSVASTGCNFEVRHSTDPTFATYGVLGTYSSAGAAPWQQLSYDISALPSGSRIRIQFTGSISTQSMHIDDLAITSSVATENTIVIMPRTGGSCTFPLVFGMTYTFYDQGGSSDTHNVNNNSTITFDPAPGKQVELTFVSFNTGATSTGDVDLGNTTPALTGYTGTTVPSAAPYLGTAADIDVTFNLTTTTSTAPNAGYVITVRCTDPVATCSDPTSPTVPTSGIQATQAQLNFTPPGAAPSNGYQYYFSTSSTTPPAGAAATPSGSVTASGQNMTGLSPNTTYYTWVRSDCGGSLYGNWVQVPGTFTTKCSAYPVPYTEDFNGLNGPLPTCTSSDVPGAYSTNIVNGNLFSANQGATFFTKPVTLTGGTVYRLTFDYGSINGVVDFDVNYGTTNFTPTTSNINIFIAQYSGISGLQSAVYNFTPAVTGTYYVGFTYQGGESVSTQFNLDNITIEEETCFPPTALTPSAITATSATMSWTPPAAVPSNGYQYYISTSNVQPEFSTPPTGTATGSSVGLGPLTSGTTYYVWVRSNCAGRFSAWSVVSSFMTTVVVVTTINMSTGTTAMVCGNIYNFFDSGGSASAYSDFEDFTRTFTVPAGKQVKAVFTSFSTESGWDGLSIHNGANTGAPLISSGLAAGFNAATCPAGSYYGTTSPGTVTSTSGALTFHFTSDFIITRPGWSATITCVTSPTITSFTPNNNNCGTPGSVVITGTNFSGAGVPAITGVSFNGVPVAAGQWVVNSATQITVTTVPAGITTGPISVSNAEATAVSSTSYTVNPLPPVTTGVTICAGGSGSLTTSSVCTGFNLSAPTITGSLNGATDPTAPRPQTSVSNSTACSFATNNSNYTSVQFQVSATGLYNFEMSSSPAVDGMGYITTGAFTAGNCGSGTFVIVDDDSGPGTFPLISVNLTAGVTYTLWTTVWGTGNPTLATTNFTWTVTSPGGGSALLFSNAQMEWFTVATGGTAIGTGTSFNPVGVSGSGLPNTNTPGTYNFYAGCSSNPTCRTLTTFVIDPTPIAGTVSANQTICSGSSPANITLTGSTGSIQWQSSPDNSTWSNIVGATATPLTSAQMGTLTATRYYRAVLTTPCGTLNSGVVTVTVSPTSVAGTITPATTTVCAGTNSTLLTLAGNTGTIQWQSSPDNTVWTNIASATNPTYTATNLSSTTYYRAVVTSGACPAQNSASVVINVNPATVAGTASSNQSICTGDTPANITLSGNTGTIQWQSSPDNSVWTNIGGATTATLSGATIGALATTTYFRAVVTSGICASANSNVVTITVTPVVGGTVSPISQGACTTISDITVSGYTGTVSGWEWATTAGFATPNTIPASASATLTAAQIGVFSGTRYYRAVITAGTCNGYSAVASVSYDSTTWSAGSWSNGVPNSSIAAIFASNYTATAALSACSIQVLSGANVIVNPGVVITVENEVNVNAGGSLTFENTSSLLQVNNVSNIGPVVYKRTTTPMSMFDYTYWSSPLSPQTLFGVSPATLPDKYFAFNTASNTYQQLPSNSIMVPGKGYIIRAPQGWPTAPATAAYTAVFNGLAGDGVPNNGNYSLAAVVSGANVMNLLGNPYPSGMNADAFLTANASVIDGTIYLWTHNTPITSNQYTGSDYAVYNLGGSASAATNPGINNQVPNGTIGAAQGFFVKALANGAVNYNNSMRVGNNTQFYRPAGTSTPGGLVKNRVWLNLTNSQGAFKQAMVGYIQTATNQRDWGFDSDVVEAGNPVNLYSIQDTEHYVIQGRALPFDINDQVPLGVKFNYAGVYEITLSAFDGLFAHQEVYLEDKLLNVVHNLTSGSYSFTTEAGTFETRFVLRYTDGTALGVGETVFGDNTVFVFKNDLGININTSNAIMESVKIFDVRGRLIAQKDQIGSNTYQFTNLPETQEVLLVKVTSADGATVTKKLVY